MKRPRSTRRTRAVALVIMLGLLSLLSVLLVAFTTRARLDLSATGNYSAGTQAEELARGAVDTLVGQLRAEMAAGSVVKTHGGGHAALEPKSDANTLPQRVDVPASLNTLIKVSRTGTPFFRSSTSWEFDPTEGPDLASSVETTSRSLNRRQFAKERWNGPRLVPESDFEAQFPVPNWIYVNRNGPQNLSGYSKTYSEAKTQGAAGGLNPEYVLGRYAYAVYDVSGLLDINVAGHPGALADIASGKGSIAWADLASLGEAKGVGDGLISWRNAASLSDYEDHVLDYGQRRGFLETSPGDQRFLSRSDLVRYSEDNPTSLPLSALPQFTILSRELNAPSWTPRTPANEDPNRMGACQIDYEKNAAEQTLRDPETNATVPNPNRTVYDVRVTKTFTRHNYTEETDDDEAAVVGEPLLKRRFPLTRLALFAQRGSAATDMIRKCFGLERNSDGYRWDYTAFITRNGKREIRTLDEVADAGREPNFFELLNAGILYGSLGVHDTPNIRYPGRNNLQLSHQLTMVSTYDLDPSRYLQILRIGACAIDQYDEDDNPTIIADNTVTGDRYYPSDVAGVENLPYIHSLFPVAFRRMDRPKLADDPDWILQFPFIAWYMQFQVWNPHANAAQGKSDEYRIEVDKGYVTPSWSSLGNYYPEPEKLPDGTDNPFAGQTYRQLYADWQRGAKGAVRRSSRNFYTEPSRFSFTWNPRNPGFSLDRPKLLSSDMLKETDPRDKYTFRGRRVLTGIWMGDMWLPANLDNDEPISHYQILSDDYGFLDNDPATMNITRDDYDDFETQSLGTSVDINKTRGAISINLQKNVGGKWITYQRLHRMRSTGSAAVHDYRPRNVGEIPGWYTFRTAWWRDMQNYIGDDASKSQPNGGLVVTSDPRTNRHGWVSIGNVTPEYHVRHEGVSRTTGRISWSVSPWDNDARSSAYQGPGFEPSRPGLIFSAVPYESPRGTWYTGFAVGELAENRVTDEGCWTRGADWIIRRGDSWIQRDVNVFKVGATNEARPIVLNRPFTSVGELGHVYRDEPWKSLNAFWSDSADAALLDLFTLTEEEVRAGAVNPNSAPDDVLTAILADVRVKPKEYGGQDRTLTASEVKAIVESIREYLGPRDEPEHVLRNAADIAALAQHLQEDDRLPLYETQAEALARTLADVTNTRTWNLFIDVVAQAGRFASTSADLQQFLVEGERRYWVHLSLDRYTGELVAMDIEPVFE